jgi:hypothetical protein
MTETIVMETVDSDKLKPYLRNGDSDCSVTDHCLLPDSCGNSGTHQLISYF